MQTVLKHLPMLVGLIASAAVSAETILHVDASAPARAPLENTLKMGASVSPSGERLGVNSQYLTRNGQPWMPVMGEFHYSRTPAKIATVRGVKVIPMYRLSVRP